jgi:transposase
MTKNHCLAKSINDAGWYIFRTWLETYSKIFNRVAIAVNPAYTSQNCSSCGVIVKKSLSTRTHICKCGCELDRDHNAAINILNQGLKTLNIVGDSQTIDTHWTAFIRGYRWVSRIFKTRLSIFVHVHVLGTRKLTLAEI